MKIPKARRLPSGSWFIQLRLNGESIPVTAATEKNCIREAQAIKAEYLAGRKLPTRPESEPESPTLAEAIDTYISNRNAILSPSTIRGYRAIQAHRFPGVMQRRVTEIRDDEWQSILNAEMSHVGATTVRKAFALVRTAILHETGHTISIDRITLPDRVPAQRAYLTPDEIPIFVKAVAPTQYAVPALLALSSLRISEISALRWEEIPANPEFIFVRGAVVRGVDTAWVRRDQNKNQTSTRKVPILIPELQIALERDRKPEGSVLNIKQDTLRSNLHRICRAAGITEVTPHGLRHSFASLAYHLQIPERHTMDIGGWSDLGTMQRIYTHIEQSDITRYEGAMSDFYSGKNANENANKKTPR